MTEIEILKPNTGAFITIHDERNGKTRIIQEQWYRQENGTNSLTRLEAVFLPETFQEFAEAVNKQLIGLLGEGYLTRKK